MDIHSLNDEIPVEIINRNLLFIKRNLYYNREGKPLYKNGKEYCKKRLSSSKFMKNKYNRKLCCGKMYLSNSEKAKKAREERAKKAKEEREKKERAKKAREEREKKAREEREKKAREEREKKEREKKAREEREKKAREEREKKAREEREKKAREERARKDRENNKDKVGGGGGDDDDDDNNNADDNNNNNNNNNNDDNNSDNDDNNETPTNAPTNSYQMTQAPAATFAPTNTYMSNASILPSENGRQKISVAGISVIVVILVGVVVLVGLAVYRKRYNLRRGAVRLYDEPDQNDTSVMPRYLSSISNMRSLRIPSMPPKVQLTRLSSATILLPFRENNSTSSNNNNNNPAPSFNNLNNNYLSPYTKVHPNSSPSGGLTVSDQNSSHKTDSVQSQESYSMLESSFPIPPQRAVNNNYNTTPTNATFGDMYKLKPG